MTIDGTITIFKVKNNTHEEEGINYSETEHTRVTTMQVRKKSTQVFPLSGKHNPDVYHDNFISSVVELLINVPF